MFNYEELDGERPGGPKKPCQTDLVTGIAVNNPCLYISEPNGMVNSAYSSFHEVVNEPRSVPGARATSLASLSIISVSYIQDATFQDVQQRCGDLTDPLG